MNALVRYQRRSFTVLFFLCLHAAAWSQLKADFNSSPVSGCSPLIVSFVDQSTGSPTQWKWDLGNGVTSLLKSPSATYFNPGTYNVKLVVHNATGADSVVKDQYITVYANPTVDFSADKTTGCFPLSINFSDKSSPGDGTVSSWQWDFGDGNVSSQQNPSHIYTATGAYNVTLRITNSFGCTKTFSKAQYINIADGVKADFSNTFPTTCSAPATIQFTNSSTGPGPLTYTWKFGDGASSTTMNPSHNYTVNGSYSVSLVATSPQGCTDTATKKNLIILTAVKADFTVPNTICVGQSIKLANTSSPQPISVSWNFGDGTTSTDTNAVKTYATPGTYTIKLVSNFGGCLDSISKQITVAAKPIPSFVANTTAFCKAPASVSFTNQTTGASSVLWKFGDGTTSTASNPTHTYTSTGNFTVTLMVANAAGCSDSIVKTDYIQINKPTISIAGLAQKGCAPITIQPTAFVTSPQPVASYFWDFGDGATSTSATPSHTYNAAGTYNVKLRITTTGGCTDSITIFSAVRAGTKPKASFVYYPVDVCPLDQVHLIDSSKGQNDQWWWSFGDGGYSSEQNPVHQYSDTGWVDVQLIVYNNTCPDTFKLKNAVHIKPPISIFDVTNNCNDRLTKKFTDKSLGAETWFWEFGDGTSSTQQNPAHTYATTGTYTVKLTVTNGTCSHWSAKTMVVVNEKANFNASDTVLCRNSTATFTAPGVTRNNITSWQWNFGDGASSKQDSVVSHLYTKTGSYKVTLLIKDFFGCPDSSSMWIKVNGPTADFSVSSNVSCLPNNNTKFTDLSKSDGIHSLTKWVWNYGDGNFDSSGVTPNQHSYTAAGNYTIGLLVQDSYGCTDSIAKPAAVIIAQPKADFTSNDTLTCTGKNVAFINNSIGSNLQYVWNFGDGNTTTKVNPIYQYNSLGQYSIKLLATDQYGCKDSVTRSNFISISYPKAKFTVSDSVGTCPPLLVQFKNLSTNFTSIAWDFGDGNTSTLDSPSHFYTQPGIYYATATVTGPGGCIDVATQKIEVKGPTGTLTYTPLTGCKPLSVNLKASAKNIASFTWDFADGEVTVTKDSVASHVYVNAGSFTPKLILTDVGGCSVPIIGSESIQVIGSTTSFTMSNTSFCNDGTVQFTNTTVSNDLITAYQWNFGDGNTGADKHASHHYTAPGVYTVSMLTTTQHGCVDSVMLTDTIRVFANPVITIAGDSSGCSPVTVRFKGNVVSGDATQLNWQWNLGNGDTSTAQNPSVQTYTAGSYSVGAVVTDNHGCTNSDSKQFEVYSIPAINAGADAWICRGSFAQLTATGATTYAWNAASSLSCINCDAPLAAPTDSTTYVVTGFNSFGCSSKDSVTINVHQPFTLSVEKGDTICVGKTVRLAASGTDQYIWTPSVDIADANAGVTTARPQTSTLYQVIGKDNFNCFTDTASVYIKVWPMPTVDAGSDLTLGVGNVLTLKPAYSADVSQYQWSNAQTLSCATCPSPVAKPKGETKYSIEVKNDGGCTAKAEVTVHVICNNGNLFIPNTFSPNSDGRNDRFYPRGTGINSIKSLKVFNRWGEVVFSRENFQANDASLGWDGTYKGEHLSPDVYIYTCEVVCMNNEILLFKGDVTLLR